MSAKRRPQAKPPAEPNAANTARLRVRVREVPAELTWEKQLSWGIPEFWQKAILVIGSFASLRRCVVSDRPSAPRTSSAQELGRLCGPSHPSTVFRASCAVILPLIPTEFYDLRSDTMFYK